MEVIFEMDSAIVEAKVARVKQMLNPREGGPSQVLVEVELEALRNGKETTISRTYDITSPGEVRELERHLMEIGIEKLREDDLLASFVDAVGRDVTARMFFDDDGVAKGYILGTGQEIDGESEEGQTKVEDIDLFEEEEENIGELPWDFYGGDKLVLGDWER